MGKSFRDAIILIAIFGAGWALFSYLPWFQAEDIDASISIEQEEKLGEMLMEHFYSDAEYKRIEGTAADSAVTLIAERLLDSLGNTPYDYKVYVVESEEINAFTLPGGNIVVLSGLIEFAENPDEVAAVLAHEMGHVEHRHTIDALVREFSLTILITVIGGNENILLSDILQSLISTSFSRSQETEADEFSLELLEKSNTSPRALGTFFRRLNRKYGTLDQKLEIFMTHPAKSNRIKMAMEYELKEGFKPVPYDLDWDRVQASVSLED